MGDDVVGRVEALAIERVGDHRHRAVVLVAHHTPRQMLARDLAALEVEGVAIAVVRRHAEDADLAGIFQPAQLAIVRDIAPHQIPALAAPCRALTPQRTGPQPLDRRVPLHILREQRIDDDDVGVKDIDIGRCVRPKVARRAGDDARRHDAFRLGQRAARRGDGGNRADQRPPRHRAAIFPPVLVVACHEKSSPNIAGDGGLIRYASPEFTHPAPRAPRLWPDCRPTNATRSPRRRACASSAALRGRAPWRS